jgi:DNA-binding NarL/FixJ family response regulator
MVSEGRTNKEIAWHLGLADVTIKYNMRNICEKLQAKNRAQAVNNARTSGII